jgi:hypothetical protein
MKREEVERTLSNYDDATADVTRSTSSTFDTNLEQWFEVLEEIPAIAKIVRDLEQRIDFAAWYEKAKATEGSMAGSGELKWPAGRENRLATQLSLFRSFCGHREGYLGFHSTFIGSASPRLDDMVRDVTDQIFAPMARDLRKHIVQLLERVPDIEVVPELMFIPAADRFVPIDHNNPEYNETLEHIAQLQEAIRGSNEYGDQEEKGQGIAELGAIRRLLDATRARVDVLVSLAFRGLKHIAQKATDVAIATGATALLALLGRLTGLW